jgi:uncharacterized protein (TIRG00374 family)
VGDSSRRARLFRLVRYLVGVVALVWVLRLVEWERAVSLLADVSAATTAALLGVSVAGLVVAFLMWHVLLTVVDDIRFADTAGASLTVLFINHLLPSRLSGRAVAPFVIRERTGMDYASAVGVAGVHTGLYAVLYGLVSLVGLVAILGQVPVELTLVLALSTLLYGAAGTLVLLAGVHMGAIDRIAGALETVAGHVPVVGDRLAALSGTLPEFTTASASTFRTLLRDPGAMLSYAVGWVVVLVVVPGLRVWLVFEGLGVGGAVHPAVFLPLYLIVAYSVTLLPLTPGGVGITEATATAVFVALGVPSEVVVPAIFADRLLGTYLPVLVGWYPSLKIDFSALTSS